MSVTGNNKVTKCLKATRGQRSCSFWMNMVCGGGDSSPSFSHHRTDVNKLCSKELRRNRGRKGENKGGPEQQKSRVEGGESESSGTE